MIVDLRYFVEITQLQVYLVLKILVKKPELFDNVITESPHLPLEAGFEGLLHILNVISYNFSASLNKRLHLCEFVVHLLLLRVLDQLDGMEPVDLLLKSVGFNSIFTLDVAYGKECVLQLLLGFLSVFIDRVGLVILP
jgi:hypothetical protein